MIKYTSRIIFLLLISVASAAMRQPEVPLARQQYMLNGQRRHDIFNGIAMPVVAEMVPIEGENQIHVDIHVDADIRVRVDYNADAGVIYNVVEPVRPNHIPGNDIDEEMRLRIAAFEFTLGLVLRVAIPFVYFAADRYICIRRALTPTDAMKRKLSTYSFRIMLVLCLALTEHLRIMLNWEKENAIRFFVPCLVFFWGLWLKYLNYPRPQ